MANTKPAIPPARKELFTKGIRHPELYLWDAWSYVEKDTIHLYCLAVNRTKPDGKPLLESERNDYAFHVRHFTSSDNGESWQDKGCFQQPGIAKNDQDARNVWSGSIELLPDGNKLVGYTGVYEVDSQRTYLQNISLASSTDGNTVDWIDDEPLSCPLRDRVDILAQGYYLDAAEKLGHSDGEEGGPIMTWRDPFIILDEQNRIHIVWSAKSGPTQGVIAHGLVEQTSTGFRLEKLYRPVSLPDGASFTQAELPKIYHDKANKRYYLIVASCDRLYESQSIDEVEKIVRLYKSDSLRGPWITATDRGSAIKGTEGLYGMTVLKTDFENNRLFCIAPYTDGVVSTDSLTFCAPFYVDLKSGSVSISGVAL